MVREFEGSHESMSGFATRHRIGVSSLRNWIAARSPGKCEDGAAFVELAPLVPDLGRIEYDYEIALAFGHTLKLRRGFDSREVQALVASLSNHA